MNFSISPRLPWSSGASPLPPALGAPRVSLDSEGVRIALYLYGDPSGVTAQRSPLLLIHGMGLGASAMDMRPLFEYFTRPDAHTPRVVAALELPGFGSSERTVADATPLMMATAILAALHQLRSRGLQAAADVCTLGLSCEFATAAALQDPSLFRSLALISPSGLESWRHERYDAGHTHVRPALRRMTALAPLGELLFRSMVTRAALRQHFEELWDSPLVDEDLLDYSHRSAGSTGARHVPLALLCGALSTRGAVELYRRLALPVWVAHGLRGTFSNVDALPQLAPAGAWKRQAYDTGAMPHFEHHELFCAQYGAFLDELDQAPR